MTDTNRRACPRRLAWRAVSTILVGAIATGAPPARGDDFGRFIGAPLFELTRQPGAKATGHLSLQAIESMPEVVRGERSALIIATTDQGNVAKLLVSVGLRRRSPTANPAEAVPVVSLDRFETIDRGDRVARKARGHDVVLFDRFEFDLDSGQLVPPGFGGDIAFMTAGKAGPGLIAIGENRLYPIDQPLAVPGSAPGRPTSGPGVVPSDFNGRYTLVSNGQMGGALEISVADDGEVTGRFRSDRNGALYPVTGRVAADLPRRIGFEIKFPRSKQAFDGLLWTEDKNVFAGTVQILDHPYSFLAVREGAPLVPESIEAANPPRPPAALKVTTRVVTLNDHGYELDGGPRSADELRASLSEAARVQGPLEVLLRVPPATPFERVQGAVRAIRGAGISAIRLGAVDPRSEGSPSAEPEKK